MYGAYYRMPVRNGMGKQELDFHCCYRGRYFEVETKAPGEQLTRLQEITKAEIESAGGVVFVVDGDPAIGPLHVFLEELRNGITICTSGGSSPG